MEALTYMNFFGVRTKGIIHVGANDGAEFNAYVENKVDKVLWIEPLPDVFQTLKDKISSQPGHTAVNTACSYDDDLSVNLNIASNRGESSSILKSSLHSEFFPEIVFDSVIEIKTSKLDSVILSQDASYLEYNLLVIDTQGAELLVLKGASKTLEKMSAVYIEVSERQLYDDSCTWPEVHEYLKNYGFSLKQLHIGRHFYGNAFYIKNSALDSLICNNHE